MKKIITMVGIALFSIAALASPPSTTLTHRDGSTTTVTSNNNGSRATGYYGGDGGVTTPKSHQAMIKEVKQAAKDKGNPVVKEVNVR